MGSSGQRSLTSHARSMPSIAPGSRWRHILAWLNDVLRFTHRYLSALSSSLSKILWTYFHRTRNRRGSRQDARPHLKGAQWPSNRCSDNRRSNPWVDGHRGATLTKHDRLVHHHSLADENVLLARRQNDAHETRCDEILGPHENPHIGLVAIFDHDLVGRQRRPTDILSSSPPLHPSRAPFPSSDPNPSQFAIEDPASVMESDPAPVVFCLIGNPVPSPIIGIGPAPHRVGSPVTCDLCGNPHFAPAGMPLPASIWFESNTEVC
jgi:hypothetical protein